MKMINTGYTTEDLMELVDANSHKCSRYSGIAMDTSYENQVFIMIIVYNIPEENIDRTVSTLY